MPDSSVSPSQREPLPVPLKNPMFAAFLAWLFPGLGHFYQGRYPKALLFFCCVFPLFAFGCYLGSDREYGVARCVYCSWRPDDKRLYFLPQACLGLAAIPAVAQNVTASDGKALLGKLMAPPRLWEGKRGWTGVGPSLDDLSKKLNTRFDLGTLCTVIAGLMNLLVIFDAAAGPLVYLEEKEEAEEEPEGKEKEKAEN